MLRVIHDRAAQGSQVLTSAPSRSQNREALHWDLPHFLENWDQYLASTGESLEHYVNPTWRPRGFADKLLELFYFQ